MTSRKKKAVEPALQIYFSQEMDTVWSKLARTFPSRAGGDL